MIARSEVLYPVEYAAELLAIAAGDLAAAEAFRFPMTWEYSLAACLPSICLQVDCI